MHNWLKVILFSVLLSAFGQAGRQDYVVGIIGAGIGGSTAALKLSDAGFKVVLIDKAKSPMARTSGINPGRSALGFHYTDVNTAYQMLEGSRLFDQFFPNMLLKDEGARYYVVKDSQVSKEDYLKLCDIYKKKYAELWHEHKDWRSLGDPESFYRILDEKDYENEVDKSHVVLGIQTLEHLIDMPRLVVEVNKRLREAKNITVLTEHEIVDAKQEGAKFRLMYRDARGHEGDILVDHVVNAAWEYRHKIDSFIGHKPDFQFTNRLKVLAKIELPKDTLNFHSMMFVRGPFAMMANSGDGTAFLTYAPVTNYTQSTEIEVPSNWEAMITTSVPSEETKVLGEKIIQGAAQFIPKLKEAKLLEVRAGVIYTTGEADPFDPKSKIHSRDESGIAQIVPGWDSLDTGKLILGPYYASQVVDLVEKRFSSQKQNKDPKRVTHIH